MIDSRKQGQPHMMRHAHAYDHAAEGFVRLDHDSPDWVLADKQAPCDCPECIRLLGVAVVATDISGEREVWKTLVRFVWHNARSVSEACVFFGIAALRVDERYAKRMAADELKAIRGGGAVNGARTTKVFHFRERMVYRTWQPLEGYTSMHALISGEHGECTTHEALDERMDRLRVLFRASWQDLRTRQYESSLRAAFANFAALTGEDRDLLAWVTQTEFAKAFNETRAAMCARRKRKVRVSLEANGSCLQPPPGGKSESAIVKYSAVQMGNKNRVKNAKTEWHAGVALDFDDRASHSQAAESLKDHADVAVRTDLPRNPKALRAYLDRLAKDAERQRMAVLCGVSAADIDLDKSNPNPQPSHERTH